MRRIPGNKKALQAREEYNTGAAPALAVPETQETQQQPAKRMRRNRFQIHGNTRCWYAKGILSHWVVAIATRSLGPIVRYIEY